MIFDDDTVHDVVKCDVGKSVVVNVWCIVFLRCMRVSGVCGCMMYAGVRCMMMDGRWHFMVDGVRRMTL